MNGYQWSKHAVLAALVFTSIRCAVLTMEVLCKESNKKAGIATPGCIGRHNSTAYRRDTQFGCGVRLWRRAPCVNLYGGEINIYTSIKYPSIRCTPIR